MTGFLPPVAEHYLRLLRETLTNWQNLDQETDTRYFAEPPQTLEDRQAIRAEGRDWPMAALTMVGMKRLSQFQSAIVTALEEQVPGDIVETGVWRGGACILARAVLMAMGCKDRLVWVADSFAGLPPPKPEAYPADAEDRHFHEPRLAVSVPEVANNFRRFGLLDEQVRFLPGWFSDTLPTAPVTQIAVLRLDGDMYESTWVALEALYHRVAPGGFVIIDDYGAVPGCRLAVEEFRTRHAITAPLQPIDWTACYWRVEDAGRATATPPADILYRIANSPLSAALYHDIGERSAADIADTLQDAGRNLDCMAMVLDFGAGCGRVAQYVHRLTPKAEFHATDIDDQTIGWCAHHLPYLKTNVNGATPPLPYDDEKFDLVYAISVFTHLNVEMQKSWLRELSRITAPGGIVYITFHGDGIADQFASAFGDGDRQRLAETGFVYIANIEDGILPDWYQTSFQTIDFFASCLPDTLELLVHRASGHAGLQDYAVLRRREGGTELSPMAQAQSVIGRKFRWMFEDWHFAKDLSHAKGWLFTPSQDLRRPRFLINDRDLVAPTSLVPAPELHRQFPHLPEDGFFRFSLDGPAWFEVGFMSLKYFPQGQDDGDIAELTAWHMLDPALELPLPAPFNMQRVIASDSKFAFRVGGATLVKRYDTCLRQHTRLGLADLGRVLDWGCGCGRITRYLPAMGCGEIVGADIDSYNIDWCQHHLGQIDFLLSGLMPPLPFPDGHFGLVIGTSVLTHLREDVQLIWLDEIARILKPGGIAMLTIMPEHYVALVGGSESLVDQIAASGHLVRDENDQLRFGGRENYYVNAYHTADYVRRHWQRRMKLINIVPFLGTHHDTVVLRRLPDAERT